MKTFAIGDIHGAYKAMMQCFERSGFDWENGKFIVLGGKKIFSAGLQVLKNGHP